LRKKWYATQQSSTRVNEKEMKVTLQNHHALCSYEHASNTNYLLAFGD
jgi:hypothetical protein